MQTLVARYAERDAGTHDGGPVVLRKELPHLAHAPVRAIQGGPKKVKVVVKQLLHVDLAALVPSPRLRLARIQPRQQKRVRKTTRNPGYTQHLAVANIDRDRARAAVAVAELTEVIAPPRPDATVGLQASSSACNSQTFICIIHLHGSYVLPAAAQRRHADAVHSDGVGGNAALHEVTETQLPVPAAVVRTEGKASICGKRLKEEQAYWIIAPVVSPREYLRVVCGCNGEGAAAGHESNLHARC